ncbi:hypothetical protein GCM10017691_26510 [Pseudonocardia petroleophila]|uniref:Uncharacterized protein n=1 Tax=Pseudonocardia petroleophila TaxID=37331 RepID=A0A7G7MF82_9PSEU|nr:hypothetical protein [Pseudonocardia petroleophila]QNG51443.1 hypothetical protein H6H00_25455 [Pseudonocardia petroleophila]
MTVPTPGPPRPVPGLPPRPHDPRPAPGQPGPAAGHARPADPRGPDPRAAVAAAMAGLDGLAERPLAEHVEAYERVHAALGDALAAGSA